MMWRFKEMIKRNLPKKGERSHGFFSNLDNQQLLKYTLDLHGMKSSYHIRIADSSLYSILYRRKLLENFPEPKKPETIWKTFEEWSKYGKDRRYDEKNSLHISKSSLKCVRSWFNRGRHMRRNGDDWLGKFNFNKLRNKWENFEEWEIYGLSKKFDEKTTTELEESNDNEERKWHKKGSRMNKEERWLKKFPFKKVVKEIGYWENWDNYRNDMEAEIEENNGKFPTQEILKKRNRHDLIRAAYRYYDGLVSVREKMKYEKKVQSQNYWKLWNNVRKDLLRIINKNNGEFPSSKYLRRIGNSSLGAVINTYHGGYPEVREKIGYNETKREELSEELETIIGEI
jgi:hypothetical protein